MKKSDYLLTVLFFACQSGNAQVINNDPKLLTLANSLPAQLVSMLPEGVNLDKNKRCDKKEQKTASAFPINYDKIDVPPAAKQERVLVTDSFNNVQERMPSFPGGKEELMKYLSSNIKYPVDAEDHGVKGRVVCSFTISKDGLIKDIKIKKSENKQLDDAVIKALKSMPRWIPGKHKGEFVEVNYTLPITFNLTDHNI